MLAGLPTISLLMTIIFLNFDFLLCAIHDKDSKCEDGYLLLQKMKYICEMQGIFICMYLDQSLLSASLLLTKATPQTICSELSARRSSEQEQELRWSAYTWED